VQDLEAELKRATESRRGDERGLERANSALDKLQGELENKSMVQQIVGLTKEHQEAKDAQEETLLLRRQRVQMFRTISARTMEATW
jgi:hypothetical protein